MAMWRDCLNLPVFKERRLLTLLNSIKNLVPMELDEKVENLFSFRNTNMSENQGLPNTRVFRYFSVPESCPTEISDPNARPVGLENLGTTCWFNVAVQLLYHIPSFRQQILEFKVPNLPSSILKPSMEVISGLQELFISIMYSERKLIDPSRAVHSVGKLLGQGRGQQDASEFLGVVLNRIREFSPSTIEKLFIGSCTTTNALGSITNIQEFMQYSLQVNQNTTLMNLLDSSLKSKVNNLQANSVSTNMPQVNSTTLLLGNLKQSFSNLPPVFLIDICRLLNGSNPAELVKSNHRLTFSSLVFMDRFELENAEQVSKLDVSLTELYTSREETEINLKSLLILLENVPQLQKVYENYQRTVKSNTDINFELLRSLNHAWEAEMQFKTNQFYQQSKQLEREIDFIRNRELATRRPYQLHAVIVHQGQSDGGHYCIYVWDDQQNLWYHIDDTSSRQVSWDSIVQASFGGQDQTSSAHCLVYIDVSKTYSLLDVKEEYEIGPTDVLRYLKDHTDVRTRHSAYGKGQTITAVLVAIASHGQDLEPSVLLFRALDSERRRLYAICQESSGQILAEEARLLHFGVYLLANQVEFEPFIYWTLLQHFASFSLLVEARTSRVCLAARRTLAYVECSTTQEQKKLFIQWNTAYYQFRLIIRHVMNGITHVFSRNFSAAVPLAVKSLYLHHCLMSNSLGGPAMSVTPGIIHSLIEKAVTSLSEELLESDIEAVGDLACSVLFDAVINWCEYADADNLAAARKCSRVIADQWSLQVKHYLSHAAEYAPASGLQTLAEVQRKLQRVESVLDQPHEKGNPTPFDFKGHIPESPEDGEKLALKWKQMWTICTEQHILGPQVP